MTARAAPCAPGWQRASDVHVAATWSLLFRHPWPSVSRLAADVAAGWPSCQLPNAGRRDVAPSRVFVGTASATSDLLEPAGLASISIAHGRILFLQKYKRLLNFLGNFASLPIAS